MGTLAKIRRLYFRDKLSIREISRQTSLDAIEAHISQDNPLSATELWLYIDDRVSSLSDPNFPRRPGRVAGTLELVAHENYIVILEQSGKTVIALDVLHVARK